MLPIGSDIGHDIFESNVAVQLGCENLSQSASVTQDGAQIWAEEFIEKTTSPKSTPIFDFFYSLVRRLMKGLLQLIQEAVWPCRRVNSGQSDVREVLLKGIALLVVALVAGPDLFASVEMSSTLEVLGAALFLSSIAVGARLLVTDTAIRVLYFFLPTASLISAMWHESLTSRIQAVILVSRATLFASIWVFVSCKVAKHLLVNL